MSPQTDFTPVFEKLRAILQPYAGSFTVKSDTPSVYYLDGPFSEKWGKELYFASTHIRKNYVSFHLMPVYMCPDLLKGISPELKKHMQGKSCFNFKKVEPGLFKELAVLTKKGHARIITDEF